MENLEKYICVKAVDRDNSVIGGPGSIVEIDESLFTKIKHNRGRQMKIKRLWVFGGIERGTLLSKTEKKKLYCHSYTTI